MDNEKLTSILTELRDIKYEVRDITETNAKGKYNFSSVCDHLSSLRNETKETIEMIGKLILISNIISIVIVSIALYHFW